jgi:hypothetical protein
MKKLVFTALAVVAFSATSFAATKEVKENKVYGNDCYQKAADYVSNEYDPNNTHTQEQNEAAYQAYYAGCEDKQTPHLAE